MEMNINAPDYNRGIENNKENEDLISDSKVNVFPIVEVNVDEDIHATFNSSCEKVNTLHEDFQQFKTEMRYEAAKNKTKMNEILAILREKFPRNEGNDEVTLDLIPEFPLTSLEEYVEFNETLKNDEAIRKCFDKEIKRIGGDSVQKMVSNILTNCITFDVGHKLSWTGAKNSIAIENSTFANIIVGAVSHTKGKGPDCTIALIVKHVKNWLQHADDKMRYRMKKIQQYRIAYRGLSSRTESALVDILDRASTSGCWDCPRKRTESALIDVLDTCFINASYGPIDCYLTNGLYF